MRGTPVDPGDRAALRSWKSSSVSLHRNLEIRDSLLEHLKSPSQRPDTLQERAVRWLAGLRPRHGHSAGKLCVEVSVDNYHRERARRRLVVPLRA